MKVHELKMLLEALPPEASGWEATFRYQRYSNSGIPSDVETPVLGLELRAGSTSLVLIGAGLYDTWERERAGIKSS